MKNLRNFVAGSATESRSGLVSEVINPSKGVAYATAQLSNAEDVDLACKAAESAFQEWKETTPAERQRALLKIADALESRAEEIVAIESENTGKPISQTLFNELPTMTDAIRFFAGAARNLEGKSAGEYMRGMTSFIRREPIGVCAAVTPWNMPMVMAVWKWAPAIASGNTVVLKPSDTTPASSIFMAEVMSEFLPAGVFNVVTGDRDTGRLLVDHKIPGMVSLTGSVRAGQEVAKSASSDLKRVHLELGGNAPVIVFADANLEVAAQVISYMAYWNAGQACIAPTRVLVEAKAHDKFVALLADLAKNQIKTGSPDEDVFYGPLNSANQLARVQGFFDRIPKHAEVVAGGSAVDRAGYFFNPTVVIGIQQQDEMAQSEIFGPVITVQSFSDEAEAISLANDVPYGLASSIWTTSHGVAMRVSKALDFGTVWINTHLTLISEMPHGGFKHSGYGKDLSAYGFEDYTRIKHVMTNLNG